MEIAALASSPAGLALLGVALRTDHARASTPGLFLLAVASLTLACLGAIAGDLLALIAASCGAVLGCVAIIAVIFTVDARLAAKGNAKGGVEAIRPSLRIGAARRWREFERNFWHQVEALTWASTRLSGHRSTEQHSSDEQKLAQAAGRSRKVAESLHSFERTGRAALFVFIKSDRDGRVLDAAAYDPDDYL
jgi:hypothetical protein